MKHVLKSFYAKLSAIFLVLMLALGMALAVLCVRAASRYAAEATQKLNRTLAADLTPRFEPLLRDSIDHQAIMKVIEDLTGVNRRIEIYLLDGAGHVKARLDRPGEPLARQRVDLTPIRRFVQGAALPVLGDDPRAAGRRRPFSVAPIEAMGETDCYLYIILDSGRYASVAGMIESSYILRTTLWGLGLVVLLTGFAGLGLFALLTRRLRQRKEVLHAFEAGDLSRRVEVRSSDEIGQLGAAFNRMADTIERNMGEMKQADAMRRELIANVSHDLRSPIASIQGYLETILIKRETLTAEERKRYLEVALGNTQKLGRLVSALFELSKLDTQQVEPHREPLALPELVQDVVMQFRPRAEARGVQLSAELPERLPLVCADIALVERALSNLIDNALRYTPEGGQVRILLAQEDGSVRVFVKDTGPGLPAEDLPHVFERFYRVEKSRTRDHGGSGLGLAISKKVLALQGSTLEVQSTEGEGATFSFALPAAEALPAPARGGARR